jgi:hypothetical protein
LLKINTYLFIEPPEDTVDIEEAGEEICQVMDAGMTEVFSNFPAGDVVLAGVYNFEEADIEELKEYGLIEADDEQ